MTDTLEEPTSLRSVRKIRCGFCTTGWHDKCARTIRNGKVNNADRLSTCPCDHEGCPSQEPRCMDCKNTNPAEINPYTMLCEDRTACTDVQQRRRENHPIHIEMKRAKESAMAENETKAPRAKAAPKVGKCLVTGKPTKGGNFLPGMDARYVSNLVTDVIEGKATEAQAKKRLKDETGSEKLLAKFEKSVGLAKDKAAAKKAAEKEKAEKAKAAKAEKAAAKG